MMLTAVCLVLLVHVSAGVEGKVKEINLSSDVAQNNEYLTRGFNWIGDKFLGVIESFIPDGRTGRANDVEGMRYGVFLV